MGQRLFTTASYRRHGLELDRPGLTRSVALSTRTLQVGFTHRFSRGAEKGRAARGRSGCVSFRESPEIPRLSPRANHGLCRSASARGGIMGRLCQQAWSLQSDAQLLAQEEFCSEGPHPTDLGASEAQGLEDR